MKQDIIEQFYLDDSEYFVNKNKRKCTHIQEHGQLCDRCYKKSLITVMSKLRRKDQKELFFINHLYSYPSCYGNNGLGWLYKLEAHVRDHDLNQAFGTDQNIERYNKKDFLECIEKYINFYNSIKKMNFKEKCFYLMTTIASLPAHQIYDVNGILGLSEQDNLAVSNNLYERGLITLFKDGIVSELPSEGKNFLESLKIEQNEGFINIQNSNFSIILGNENNVQQKF